MAALCALTSPLAVFGPFGAPFMAARRPRACYRATFVPSPLLMARLGVPGTPWPRSNAVDVFESAEAFKITLELPGVDASALKVSFTEGVLTVTAEASRVAERCGGAEGRWLRRERAATSLRRAFRVPAGVDAEAIEATLENGVLVLVLPKSAEAAKPKDIPVAAAADPQAAAKHGEEHAHDGAAAGEAAPADAAHEAAAPTEEEPAAETAPAAEAAAAAEPKPADAPEEWTTVDAPEKAE